MCTSQPGHAQFAGPNANTTLPAYAGFVENKGQVHDQNYQPRPDVLYLFESPDMNVQFRKTGFSYDVFEMQSHETEATYPSEGVRTELQIRSHRIDVAFVGANPASRVLSGGKSDAYENFYYAGLSDAEFVYRYTSVTYEEIYPGIDIVFRAYSANNGSEQTFSLKYDIVVKPGGKLSDVRLRITGTGGLAVQDDGSLVMENSVRNLIETIPLSYLSSPPDGTPREEVQCRYKLNGNVVSIDIDTPPGNKTLVIDPAIVWGTYYGGGSTDRAYEIAWAGSGVAFCGRVSSASGIATSGTFQSTIGGGDDAYVAVFTTGGVRLWASYFGGNGFESANAVYGDGAGNIYMAGIASSPGLASTGAYKTAISSEDAFLIKFNGTGQRLWSTYLGGSSNEEAYGVTALGTTILVAGWTNSYDFPATPGALQSSLAGSTDCFVTAFTDAGQLSWATYFGGSSSDRCYTMAALSGSTAVICGDTYSASGLATAGAYQSANAGGQDGFILVMNASGQRLWSTYFGGSGTDVIRDVDGDGGNIIFGGATTSTAGISTSGVHQETNGGGQDAMLVCFSGQGQRLWGTYYGGGGADQIYGVDGAFGKIFVSGETTSSSGIASPGSHQPTIGGGYDALFADFTYNGQLICGTYYGGSGKELSYDLLGVGSTEGILVGETTSSGAIATPGAHKTSYSGAIDVFLTRLISVCGLQQFDIAYDDIEFCEGFMAQLTGGVIGGTPPITYHWSPPTGLSATNIANPLAFPTVTTVYIVEATDANNITIRDTVTVTVNPNPVADAGPDAVICENGVTTLQGSATGGTPPYSVVWGPPDGLSNPNDFVTMARPSATTKYVMVVTDAKGCVSVDTVTVVVLDPVLVFAGPDTTICKGGSAQLHGTVANATPPITWQWSPAQGLSDAASLSPIASPTVTTHYVLTVTDANGCIGFDTVTVSISDLAVDAGEDTTVCFATKVLLRGSINPGVPPYNIYWYPSAGLTDPRALTTSVFPVKTTTYILSVTDSMGCIAIDSVTVHVLDRVLVDAGPDLTICDGGTAQLNADVTGATPPLVFHWSPAQGLSDPSAQSPLATPSASTSYIVTVTDSNGCTGRDTVRVTLGANLTVDAGPDMVLCAGGSATIGRMATGGTSPFIYSWTPTDGLTDPDSLRTGAAPKQTTTYVLFVMDANGCTGMDTVTVTITDDMVVDAGPDTTLCYGESTEIGNYPLVGAPPFTISWTPAAGLSNPNVARPTASPVVTTTYIMTVTDKNGCSGSDTVTVTVSPELIASAGPDKRYCIGGSTTLEGSASGGIPPYTYSWLPGTALSSRSIARPVANPTTTTQYILCVTDSAGCTACDTVLVNVGERLFVDAGRDRYLCNNNSVSLRANVSGGTSPFTFHWSPPEGLSATNTVAVSAAPTQSTSYIVTVTDANGCTGADTVTVFVGEDIAFDAGPDATLCGGDTATIGRAAGFGNTPYTYQWSPPHGLGTPGSATTTAAPGTTTTYIVTATDADGCVAYDTVTVRVFDGPTVDAENARIICAGDTTQLEAQIAGGTPPYTLAWTPDIALSDPAVANPLAWPTATTKYTLRVTDANGCTTEDTVLVTVKSIPEVHISPGGTITLCEGDSVTLTASRGGYSYEWSNGDTTMSIVVRVGGTYRVRVTSADGCTAVSEDVTVNILPGLTPEIIGPIELCTRDSIAYRVDPPDMNSYQWTVIGGTIIEGDGTSRIRVNWDPGTVTGILEVVLGYGSCFGRDTLEVTIREHLRPTISFDGRTVLCPGSSLRLDAEIGYTHYRWSTGDTTRSITVNRSGDYYVWVEDTSGCDGYSDTIRVTESHLPGVEIGGTLVLCGSEPASLTASYGFIAYYWSSGEQDRTVRVFTPGSITVTAVDSNGCISEATVSVEQQPGLSPKIIGDSLLCTGSTGVLSVNEAYNRIVWSTGDTTQTITIHRSGTYHVQVMNSFGCIGSDTITVEERPRIYATLSTPDIEAEPGDHVIIRLWVNMPDTLTLTQIQFTGCLSFERSVFHPLSHSSYDEGKMRFIEFTGTYSGGSGVLIEIEGTALLGRVDKSTLVLDAFAWDNGCIGKQYIGGAIVILVCEEGGKRLVTTQPPEVQISVNPNPFTHSTQLVVAVHRGTNIRLEVKDALGRTIATLMESFVEPGNYSAHFDAAGLPSGVYYYILQTDTQHHTGSMRSVK